MLSGTTIPNSASSASASSSRSSESAARSSARESSGVSSSALTPRQSATTDRTRGSASSCVCHHPPLPGEQAVLDDYVLDPKRAAYLTRPRSPGQSKDRSRGGPPGTP